MDISDGLGDLWVASRVPLNIRSDTLTMERMLARVDEELTVIEYGTEADIAVLSRVDYNMPVLLMTPL